MTEIDTSTEAEARGVEKERERCVRIGDVWVGEILDAHGKAHSIAESRSTFSVLRELKAYIAAIRRGD